MKAETKLALRRWTVRTLRKLFWRADEWIHSQEMALREETHDLSIPLPLESAGPAGEAGQAVPHFDPFPQDELLLHRVRGRHACGSQPQRPAQKKARRVTAADFDLRFSS
jgi:hypothetical protein